jgi:hypothetical protein
MSTFAEGGFIFRDLPHAPRSGGDLQRRYRYGRAIFSHALLNSALRELIAYHDRLPDALAQAHPERYPQFLLQIDSPQRS